MCEADLIIVWQLIKFPDFFFRAIISIIHYKKQIILIYTFSPTNPFISALFNTRIMNKKHLQISERCHEIL